MDRKKFIQIIIIIIVIVWAFCGSLLISTSIAKKAGNDSTTTQPYVYSTTATTVPTTTQPQTTTVPAETEPAFSVTIDNNVISTSVNVGDPDWKVEYDASVSASKEHAEINKNVPVGKDNIIKAYVDGVNKLKNTENFTLAASGTLDIDFDRITGGSVAENAADSAIAANAPANRTYYFRNGYDEETGETPVTVVPPSGSFAKLSSDNVKQATAVPTGDGGYKIVITLKDETQTLSDEAAGHAGAVESIDFKNYMPSGVTLSELRMTYTGATVEVIFDKDKRITSMNYTLPIRDGYGKGTYKLLTTINLDIEFHGEQTRSCIITY